MTEMQCVITGKVQRVGYRDYVQGAAGELGLFGYAKNLADGSVEVVVQGEPDMLKQMVEYLHEGSSLSQVVGVAVEWRTSTNVYDDFSCCR